ncbi:MAG: hypothetical protein ACRQFF_07300 [Sphaerochaeta sp.]
MDLNQMEFINNCTGKSKDCELCIIISHSCDIARECDKEPFVEVLPCHKITKPDGICLTGSNCRRLDFSINNKDKLDYYCINAFEKIIIDKNQLDDSCKIEGLNCDLEITFFQNWLAARYRRQTLSDELNNKIKKLKIGKKIKSLTNEIVTIFINEDIQDEITEYTLIFVSDYNNADAKEKIDNLVDKLNYKLTKLPEDDIILTINHIQDIDLTYDLVSHYYYYNCDYLCTD